MTDKAMDELRKRANAIPSINLICNEFVPDGDGKFVPTERMQCEVVAKADAIAFAEAEVERAMERARADHAEWERQAKDHEDSLVAEAEKWRALALAKEAQRCRS